MPFLPSGRRIEFSLDRFHAMLEMLPENQASLLVDALDDPDDLLHVLDIVVFDERGRPHFAECVASAWRAIAHDWPADDRQALGRYIDSSSARAARELAVDEIRGLRTRPQHHASPSAYRHAA